MAKAEIIITQSPHGSSPAGKALRGLDLYATNSELIYFTNSLDGNNGVGKWEWTLIDRPPNSSAVLIGATTSQAALQSDERGRYVVSLRVNGLGNDTPGYSTTVAGVSFPQTGVDGLGNPVGDWDLPAFHEGTYANWEDAFSANNANGFQTELYRILSQIRLNGQEVLGLGQDIIVSCALSGALLQRSNQPTPTWADSGYTFSLNAANYTFNEAKFKAVLMREGSAGTVKGRLYDVTNAVPVADSEVTTTSTSPVDLSSSALTVGGDPGNIRNDALTLYKLQLAIDSGTSADYAVALHGALLFNV